MRYRFTNSELKNKSDKELLLSLISERKTDCTNIYSPLYKRLSQLFNTLENSEIKSLPLAKNKTVTP